MHTPRRVVQCAVSDLNEGGQAHGSLWRDVVNTLEDAPVTPAGVLRLLDAVAPGWAGEHHFLKFVAERLADPGERSEIERETRLAGIGWRLRQEERDALALDARDVPPRGRARGPVRVVARRRLGRDGAGGAGPRQVLHRLLAWLPEERALLAALRRTRGDREVLVYRLRENVRWIGELERLRSLARATWGLRRRSARWTLAELDWVNGYYEDQQPAVASDADADKDVDPFALRVVSGEQGLGMGLEGLAYCMTVLMQAAVIDFVDDLLETTRFPQARGSMRWVECGSFVGRRAVGYGQLFCTDRCKKRAAKRRYRTRRAA